MYSNVLLDIEECTSFPFASFTSYCRKIFYYLFTSYISHVESTLIIVFMIQFPVFALIAESECERRVKSFKVQVSHKKIRLLRLFFVKHLLLTDFLY